MFTQGTISFGQFVALMQLAAYVNEPVVRLINASLMVNAVRDVNAELKKQLLIY